MSIGNPHRHNGRIAPVWSLVAAPGRYQGGSRVRPGWPRGESACMTTDSAIARPLTRDQSTTLFSATMTLVAITTAVFAVGAYAARDVSPGWAWVFFIAAFLVLFAVSAAARAEQLAVGLLFGFGFLMGAAAAPTFRGITPGRSAALWEAGGATALFIAGFGALGYGTRRDLSRLGRNLDWGPPGSDRLRLDRNSGRASERLADLRPPRPGAVRRADQLRLPTAAPVQGHPIGTGARGVDLPRHPQRVPPPAVPGISALRVRSKPGTRMTTAARPTGAKDAQAWPTLTPAQLDRLTIHGKPVDVAAGNLIFRAREPTSELIAIQSGCGSRCSASAIRDCRRIWWSRTGRGASSGSSPCSPARSGTWALVPSPRDASIR